MSIHTRIAGLLMSIASLTLTPRASAQYIPITGSHVQNASGVPLSSGSICALPTDAKDAPIRAWGGLAGGPSGNAIVRSVCTTIMNGVIASGFQVADPATTYPLYILYRVTITDLDSGQSNVYRAVTVLGPSFSWDTYHPVFGATNPGMVVYRVEPPGPTGPAGPTGYMGAWVSRGTYNLNDRVSSGGVTHVSLTSSNGSTPASSPTQWTALSPSGVINAAEYPGADIGAQANAAFAGASIMIIPTIYIPAGSYTYSTDMAFTGPVTLRCEPGTILNYTGTGKAVKMGPDGLTTSTYSGQPYTVDGCQFTGGASAAYGIYFNEFLTQTFVRGTTFYNFGNATAWNIWYEGQNWDARADQIYMWTTASQAYNGIYMNAADPANLASGDFGQSFLRLTNSHIQNSGGAGQGVYLNGWGSKIETSDIAMYGGPNIQIGAWANGAELSSVYGERPAGSQPCISYGDTSGPRVGNYIASLSLSDTVCNVHNTDFGTTASFLAPASSQSGIQNATITRVFASSLTPGNPLIVQNNLGSQFHNVANDVSGAKILHSVGSFLANQGAWGGDSGESPVDGGFTAGAQYRSVRGAAGQYKGYCTQNSTGGNEACFETSGTGVWDIAVNGHIIMSSDGNRFVSVPNIYTPAFYLGDTFESHLGTAATAARSVSFPDASGTVAFVLTGTSGSIGGSALATGACSTGTLTVTGATTSMVSRSNPVTYPGDGFLWESYVSAANTVSLKVCALVAGTPVASVYNVRVIQ